MFKLNLGFTNLVVFFHFRFSMEKMLARLLMVREVQEHMLADQA
jgi:hypothetical protein